MIDSEQSTVTLGMIYKINNGLVFWSFWY